jgi:pyruvate kinase
VERVGESAEEPEVEVGWSGGGQTAAVVAAGYQLASYDLKGSHELAAFVVLTETGTTAQFLSRLRPRLPILALTGSRKALDQLQLVWGVQAWQWKYSQNEEVNIPHLLEFLVRNGTLIKGQKVIVLYGETWGTPGRTNVVRVQEVI